MNLLIKKAYIVLISIPLIIVQSYACQSLKGRERAYIKVSDQTLDSNVLIIDEILSPSTGWVIIHKEHNGQPGPMLGFCKVAAGLNKQLQVQINPEQATITLYASLYTDAGITDTLEFPGSDLPVSVDGQTIRAAFQIK